jgi:hypothetical protein
MEFIEFLGLLLIQKIKYSFFWIYYHIMGTDSFSITTSDGNEIRPSNVWKCIDCGCKITKENNSGWEYFVGHGGYTQPACKKCDEIRSQQKFKKAKD